nr:hypothetical protein Iba_chr04aCG19030 [Ipomoea batatas]
MIPSNQKRESLKEEDKVDEIGESSNEDDGEQGKGETEQNGLPDGFYLVEAVRKKRFRQEAQSVGGAKKKKRESSPSAKKFKFPKRGECVDLWNLGDDHSADKDLD